MAWIFSFSFMQNSNRRFVQRSCNSFSNSNLVQCGPVHLSVISHIITDQNLSHIIAKLVTGRYFDAIKDCLQLKGRKSLAITIRHKFKHQLAFNYSVADFNGKLA